MNKRILKCFVFYVSAVLWVKYVQRSAHCTSIWLVQVVQQL